MSHQVPTLDLTNTRAKENTWSSKTESQPPWSLGSPVTDRCLSLHQGHHGRWVAKSAERPASRGRGGQKAGFGCQRNAFTADGPIRGSWEQEGTRKALGRKFSWALNIGWETLQGSTDFHPLAPNSEARLPLLVCHPSSQAFQELTKFCNQFAVPKALEEPRGKCWVTPPHPGLGSGVRPLARHAKQTGQQFLSCLPYIGAWSREYACSLKSQDVGL